MAIFCSVNYAGGFSLAVDAELVIGATASFSIKVNDFSGKGRVQFARKPFTHWAFAFYEEPKVTITVESSIQGQNFPQIANIITGAVRRVLRSKHTLPSYRIQFKPFFPMPELRTAFPQVEKISMSGMLEVTVVECSRIVLTGGCFQLYCMLSVDESQWINMDKVVGTPWIPVELEIFKTTAQALGVEFKQGDVVISVKGADVTDPKQAFRLLSQAGEVFTMLVERKAEFKWDKKEILQQHSGATQKQMDSTSGFHSAMDETTRSRGGMYASMSSIGYFGGSKPKRIGDCEEIYRRARDKGFPIRRTTSVLATREPVFLESFDFEIKNNYKYINLGIWSKGQVVTTRGMKKPRQDTMLAYVCPALCACEHLRG
ncbi:unnamed protein product, partial [Ixodes hexagonus]